jgi:hypothetical protein
MNLAMLRALPWRELVTGAAAIVSMAANRRKSAADADRQESDAPTWQELRERIESLESLQRAQAEAFAKMAEQGEKLAKAVQALSARVVVLAWVAGVSLLISLVLAAFAIFG